MFNGSSKATDAIELTQLHAKIGQQECALTMFAVFIDMLKAELDTLQPYNCVRYRLLMKKTAEWIKHKRPRYLYATTIEL